MQLYVEERSKEEVVVEEHAADIYYYERVANEAVG